METVNCIKHSLPMKLKDGNRHVWPIPADMVYLNDGTTPLADENGELTVNNAMKLGGVEADEYAKQAEVDAIRDVVTNNHSSVQDISERAVSHTLYADNGNMQVKVFGKTTEIGEGEKSPDNPYVISGVGDITYSDNLFSHQNLTKGTVTPNSWHSTQRIYTIGNYYVGLSADGYFDEVNNIAKASVTNSGITVKSNSSGYGVGIPMSVKGDTKYIVSYDVTEPEAGNIGVTFIDANNNALSYAGFKNGDTIITPNIAALMLVIFVPKMGVENTFSNVQIREYVNTVTVCVGNDEAQNIISVPILPDNSPLFGNGVIDDIVENDVLVNGERKCRVTKRYGRFIYNKSLKMYGPVLEYNNPSIYFELDKIYGSCVACNNYNIYERISYNNNGLMGVAMEGVNAAKSGIFIAIPGLTTGKEYKEAFDAQYDAGHPLEVIYKLYEPEIYYTDPLPITKPTDLENPVIITGSGETEVSYGHETKHYIDEQVAQRTAELQSQNDMLTACVLEMSEILYA